MKLTTNSIKIPSLFDEPIRIFDRVSAKLDLDFKKEKNEMKFQKPKLRIFGIQDVLQTRNLLQLGLYTKLKGTAFDILQLGAATEVSKNC